MSDRVVTELIVDARGAQQGTAEYEAALKLAQNAVDRFTASQEKQKQASQAAGTAASDAGNKVQQSAQAYSAAERAANNYLSRLDPVFFATQRLGRESSNVEAAMRGLDQQLLRGSVTADQYNQRQAQLTGRLGEVKAAAAGLAAGTLTTEQALKSLATEAERSAGLHGNLASSSKAAGFAMRDLGLQSIDAFQGIATGQPVLRTLIQQGAQVVQVNAAMGVGFRQTAASIGSFIAGLATNPIVLFSAAAAAVVGTIVAMTAASETSARRMVELQNTLRATRTDYINLAQEVNAAAKAVAVSSVFGTADARAAGLAIAGVTSFQGDQEELERLIKLSGDLAKVWGTTLPEAGKKLAAGLDDPAKAAQELADKTFPGFTQSVARAIDMLQKSGNIFGAQKLYVDTYARAVSGASEPHTMLEKALASLSEAFTTAGQKGNSFADVMRTAVEVTVSGAINSITALINKLEELRNSQPGGLRNFTPEERARFNARGAGGQVLTNPTSGAMGVFGVLPESPGSNSRYGYDITTQAGNVAAGVEDFVEKLTRANNNLDIALKNYGGFVGKDPSQYIAAVKGADTSKLPPDVAQMIDAAAARRGVSEFAGVLKGIAVVESGGKQYVVPSTSIPSMTVVAPKPEQFGPPSPTTAQAGAAAGLQAQINAADKATQGLIPGQREAIQAQIDGYKKLQESGLDYSAAIADLQGKLAGLLTPMQQLEKSLHEQAAVSGVADGAAREYAQALQQAGLAAEKQGQTDVQSADKVRVLQEIHDKLTGQYQQSIATIERQTAANDDYNAALAKSIDTFGSYAAASQHLANVEKAKEELRKTTLDTEPEYARRLDETTAALDRQTQSLNARNLQPSLDQQKQSIELLEAQTQALSLSSVEQDKYIAVFKAKQELEAKNIDTQKGLGAEYVANVEKISDLTTTYNQQKSALADLASAFTSAFDSIANAITNSLLQGTGAAVNWGNVMRSVAQQVLAQFLKLAVLNPLLNSMFGQNNSTLGTVISALGSSGGGGSSSSGGGFGINDLLTVGGAADKLTGGSISSSLTDWLGLKDTLSGVGSYLFGTTPTTATNAALTGLGEGVYGPATASQFGAATSPGLLGGAVGSGVLSTVGAIGGGIGLGSLAGGFIQSSQGKTGQGPLAGAAIGAGIGAIFGPIGALIGGLIGGAGGGFIGPKAPTPFAVTNVGVDQSGQFVLGASAQQKMDSNRTQVSDVLNAINDLLRAYGVRTTGSYGQYLGTVGSVNGAGGGRFEDPRQITSLTSFEAPNNPNLNRLLQARGGLFGDAGQLEQFLNQFGAEQKAITDFLAATTTSLTGLNQVTGTFNEQINAVTASFDPAIAGAKQLEGLWSASADQLAQLTKAEQDLTAARDDQLAKVRQAVYGGLGDQINQIYMATAQSAAERTGDPGQIRDVALWQADYQEWQKKTAVYNQFQATFGSGGWTQEAINLYMQAQDAVEKQFGEARLSIQKSYNDQMLAQQKQASDAALGLVTNITDYVRKFQVGSDSPLSPQAQFDLASQQFNAVSGAAIAGDYNSAQQFTSYADALASSARSLYGSGAGYAQAVDRILTAAGQIGAQGSDALTASVLRAESRTQTAQIVDAITTLTSRVDALQGALRQVADRPARAA